MNVLDKQRIREDFSKAADTYDQSALVQEEIGNRALERLEMLKLKPQTILDIGVGTGKSVRGLEALFPHSKIIVSDIAVPMLHKAQSDLRLCCDAEHLALKDATIDLVFSTSTFQWCEHLQQVFRECLRVMKKDAALIFTTFGPDTLKELRQSWAQVDKYQHVHEFMDMHHIGDILLASQFIDPVVDRETIIIEYQHLHDLLKDLKATGSRSKFAEYDSSSNKGLTGKEKFRQLVDMYDKFRQTNGLLPVSYEVIYGYARKASPTVPKTGNDRLTTSEVKIPIDKIR